MGGIWKRSGIYLIQQYSGSRPKGWSTKRESGIFMDWIHSTMRVVFGIIFMPVDRMILIQCYKSNNESRESETKLRALSCKKSWNKTWAIDTKPEWVFVNLEETTAHCFTSYRNLNGTSGAGEKFQGIKKIKFQSKGKSWLNFNPVARGTRVAYREKVSRSIPGWSFIQTWAQFP